MEKTIPIVIGVTGHRLIQKEAIPGIKESIRTELRKIVELCPDSHVKMLCSLAEGGDLLCADVAEELDISVIAVLPRDPADFEKDFGPDVLPHFTHHLNRAEQVIVAPDIENKPNGSSERSFRFRQAGIYIAAHSHVLLALWDGGPGTAAACGTAEAVDFALEGSYRLASGTVPRVGNRVVIHILTPREKSTSDSQKGKNRENNADESSQSEQDAKLAGSISYLGNPDAVWDDIRKTDEFNRQVRSLRSTKKATSRLPKAASEDAALLRMETISMIAGLLSKSNAKLYKFVLALLAVASALLTFSFLMYDETGATWMILICGVMLLGAWGCKRFAARSDCHRRYLDYRALAECLRVQTYLRYAGGNIRASGLLSWTQITETGWIAEALSALEIAPPPSVGHDIRSCWVQDQLKYHRSAGVRSKKAMDGSEHIVHMSLLTSVILYFLAVVFELLVGNLFFPSILQLERVELYRTILKIFLGTISAVTLFVSNYYGKQSLSRSVSDHKKMELFFNWIDRQLEQRGQTEELLMALAREELIENGNWCSYQRDNKPDLSI